MSEVKTNVRTMADLIKADHEYDSKGGKVKFVDVEKKLKDQLPGELSIDQLKEAQSFLIDATAAHTLALGEIGLKELKAKDAPGKITASSRLGYSNIDSSFIKEMSGTAMGKPWRKLGKSSGSLVVGAGRRNTPFKEVQTFLEEQAEKVFSN